MIWRAVWIFFILQLRLQEKILLPFFYDLQCGVTFFVGGMKWDFKTSRKLSVCVSAIVGQPNDLSTNGIINGVNGIRVFFFSLFLLQSKVYEHYLTCHIMKGFDAEETNMTTNELYIHTRKADSYITYFATNTSTSVALLNFIYNHSIFCVIRV